MPYTIRAQSGPAAEYVLLAGNAELPHRRLTKYPVTTGENEEDLAALSPELHPIRPFGPPGRPPAVRTGLLAGRRTHQRLPQRSRLRRIELRRQDRRVADRVRRLQLPGHARGAQPRRIHDVEPARGHTPENIRRTLRPPSHPPATPWRLPKRTPPPRAFRGSAALPPPPALTYHRLHDHPHSVRSVPRVHMGRADLHASALLPSARAARHYARNPR